MQMSQFKLVTIICEPVLLSRILTLTKELGATGFTVTEVTGEGSGEKRSGEIPSSKAKIEVVAEPEVAQTMMENLAERFFKNYAVITYSSDISVFRPEKFET
jgi:nitrogen regulatory protein P-II 2